MKLSLDFRAQKMEKYKNCRKCYSFTKKLFFLLSAMTKQKSIKLFFKLLSGVKFTAIGEFVCLQFYRRKLQTQLRTKHNELLLHAIETNCERIEAGNRRISYLKEDTFRFYSFGNMLVKCLL